MGISITAGVAVAISVFALSVGLVSVAIIPRATVGPIAPVFLGRVAADSDTVTGREALPLQFEFALAGLVLLPRLLLERGSLYPAPGA
jgi:hypothetical protein